MKKSGKLTKKEMVRMSKIPGFRSGKLWKKIVASFIYLAIIGGIISAVNGKPSTETISAPVNQGNSQVQKTNTTKPPQQDQSAALEQSIKKTIETETNAQTIDITNKTPRVISIKNDNGDLTADLNGDVAKTNADIKQLNLYNTSKILSKAFAGNQDIKSITIIWHLQSYDVKGNATDTKAINITMSSKTAATIKWENFNSDNLPKVADSYVVDPLLSK